MEEEVEEEEEEVLEIQKVDDVALEDEEEDGCGTSSSIQLIRGSDPNEQSAILLFF